jgi:hypothetical protein
MQVYSVIPQLVKGILQAYIVSPTTDFVSFQPHFAAPGYRNGKMGRRKVIAILGLIVLGC